MPDYGRNQLFAGITRQKQNKHDFLYWEFPDSGGQKAVRMGKWKGIVLNIFKGNRKIQLYDLDSDPREQTDVARYHPEIVKRMEDIMKQEHIEPELASFKCLIRTLNKSLFILLIRNE